MFKKITEKYTILVFCSILILGLGLRVHQYTQWPREGATFDEFAWTFLGLSMWESGVPTSWSPHSAYKNKVEYFNPQGARFTLVTPYLEHPPLFGLIAGAFARARGVMAFDDVNIAKIRPLAIFLGVGAIAMVYLLGRGVYGEMVGLLAAFLYAITPTVVVGSRLVQNENFFIPFFLLSLYLAHRYVQRPTTKLLAWVSLISASLVLAKIPWIASSFAVAAIFAFSKKWRATTVVLGAVALFLGGFLVYGFLWDKEVFMRLWALQLARYDMRFDSLFMLFRDPLIVDRTVVDGWIYFGWVTMVLLLIKDIKKHLPIVLGFLAYGTIFVFAIPSEGLHGWYRYPFYPFLTIATAVFIRDYMNVNYFVSALFYLVVGLSLFAESWGRAFGFSYPIMRGYIVLVALGALPGLFPQLKDNALFQRVNMLIIAILVSLSFWMVFAYNEQ
jgi:4-amino-4-deoxy-L-arabinose transferase-like glycosyltransferase